MVKKTWNNSRTTLTTRLRYNEYCLRIGNGISMQRMTIARIIANIGIIGALTMRVMKTAALFAGLLPD